MFTTRVMCAVACLMFGCGAAPAEPFEGGADSTTTGPLDGGECSGRRACAEGETCWWLACGKCGRGYSCGPTGCGFYFVERCSDGSFGPLAHIDCGGDGPFSDPQCTVLRDGGADPPDSDATDAGAAEGGD